ncbi:hypothetical protein ASD64_02140 [Mesorhizobium sp. Root157]|uniref:hypothetical protein n=1 Tax=Mesorhizobium sp. Root157 TaxID=1736477 RepID=UPI0006F4CDC2|nr:hypothetical protein [Mesorhizobium sp. Root157]KRA00387.1 hypothetical protein ASD64_02140 [Mesorhizobium sp. Root157]
MAAGTTRLRNARFFRGTVASALLLASLTPAHAACPMELAVYSDRDDAAWIDFRPTGESAVVTNTFKMVLDKGVVLDGMVMWSEGVRRPYASLMYQCPEGDVTGEEIAACTLWEGVVYSANADGKVELIAAEGVDAPQALIFPDLGPTLRLSAVYGEDGLSKVPWDVFALKGCQE